MPGIEVWTEPELADIQSASARIGTLIHRTPVFTSHLFDRAAGLKCFFKCENLQRGGSFKMRGAANFLTSLSEQERRHGVVAYSSGNHAQAVAIAAEQLGVAATIIMPYDAPKAKVESTLAHGAKVVHYDRHREDREAIGQRMAAETGAALVPPYDHPWTIAGQGTAALELLEQAPELEALLVCVGGGGLLSGTLIAAKGIRPEIRVYGAEPQLANDWALSLAAGKQVAVDASQTIADGLRAPRPGDLTFPIVKRLCDGVLLVTDDEIKEAMRFLLTRLKLVVEPSGAAAAAAALFGKLPKRVRSAGVMLTGGNVDLALLKEICAEAQP